MPFYFDKFESRIPPLPVPYSAGRELLWQFLAVVMVGVGVWYIHWRWSESLNYNALWFAIPLAIAETLSVFGMFLFVINLWKVKDYPQQPPPALITECVNDPGLSPRPIMVDVFFPTYNEDEELVRLSIRDAKKMIYPHPIVINIHVLDDGKREKMQHVAKEEGVNYITRSNNIGFKAGNMRNAMEVTSGDFIVICDADTRPFPTMLIHTMGYFRDPDVAWVQTPQWFFDLPEGQYLTTVLNKYLGLPGRWVGQGLERVFGPIVLDRDPFNNDPSMFYDVIQRRRNWANASFCCGAGSIHRREAIMQVALKEYAAAVEHMVDQVTDEIEDPEIRSDLAVSMTRELALETEFTPYKFHVSEDIYTSIELHSDRDRTWKSVYHPGVECKMLSPQDMLTWITQRFKYAGGTLDIALHDNPLFRPGLRFPQKLMYASTIWSYLGSIWNVMFLFAPPLYLFTGITPISTYSEEFLKHIIPFLFCNELAMTVGVWGISSWRGQAFYLSFFPVNLRALWIVLKKEKIKFVVTPKQRQQGAFGRLVIWQMLVIALTVLGLIYAGIMVWLGYRSDRNAWIVNMLWGINNIMAMYGMVRAAYWRPDDE